MQVLGRAECARAQLPHTPGAVSEGTEIVAETRTVAATLVPACANVSAFGAAQTGEHAQVVKGPRHGNTAAAEVAQQHGQMHYVIAYDMYVHQLRLPPLQFAYQQPCGQMRETVLPTSQLKQEEVHMEIDTCAP